MPYNETLVNMGDYLNTVDYVIVNQRESVDSWNLKYFENHYFRVWFTDLNHTSQWSIYEINEQETKRDITIFLKKNIYNRVVFYKPNELLISKLQNCR